jgi:hypothetical protein
LPEKIGGELESKGISVIIAGDELLICTFKSKYLYIIFDWNIMKVTNLEQHRVMEKRIPAEDQVSNKIARERLSNKRLERNN